MSIIDRVLYTIRASFHLMLAGLFIFAGHLLMFIGAVLHHMGL